MSKKATDLSKRVLKGTEIESEHVKYNSVKEGFEEVGIIPTSHSQNAHILWWDGTIHPDDFANVTPMQRINKIPEMDVMCYKSSFVHYYAQMKRLKPNLYNFFPNSYLLPFQFTDLQREHNRLRGSQGKPVTWIVKPRAGCCGKGIRLIQHVLEVSDRTESSIVQKYIPPYLLGGYKFDFRFYVLISSLNPYTVYIYHDGLSRFCTQKYQPPDSTNLKDMYQHLTNTSINVSNENPTNDFTKLASEVLQELKAENPKFENLWDRIKEVSFLTFIALWRPIAEAVSNSRTKRPFLHTNTPMELEHFSKFFHLLGIDVLISSTGKPYLLELNDRPSMAVTFDVERDLKRCLVRDALSCITIDGSPVAEGEHSANFEVLIPPPKDSPNFAMFKELESITSQSFRVPSLTKVRPNVIEKKKTKRIPETFAETFV